MKAAKNTTTNAPETTNALETTATTEAELAIVTTADVATTITLDGFGYKSSALDTDGDGNLLIHVKNDDGDEIVTSLVGYDTATVKAVQAMTVSADMDKIGKLALCYYLSKVGKVASDFGFKSVGAFAEAQCGLSAVTANQYARVGALFITDKDGTPAFRREWLRGVSITNLVQSLALVKKCGDDIDKFYDDYVKSGKLHLFSTLANVKKELAAIGGKAGNGKGSRSTADTDTDTDTDSKADSKPATVSPLTAWAMVTEYLIDRMATYSTDGMTYIKDAMDVINAVFNGDSKADSDSKAVTDTETDSKSDSDK